MRSAAIAVILSAVVSALLTWFVADSRHRAAMAQLQLDHQAAQTRALAAAHKETLRMQKESDDAINRANERAKAAAAAAAAAAAELDRMRNALSEARRRIAGAPVEALREYAGTVSDLYGECEGELAETARAATGHAADVALLIDAWPVNPPD